MYGIFIILLMIAAMNSGCTAKTVAPIEIGINQSKFKKCMSAGEKEKLSESRLKEECEEYAELVYSAEKDTAIAVCTKRKEEEIGWTKWEIERYCTRFWRGYK